MMNDRLHTSVVDGWGYCYIHKSSSIGLVLDHACIKVAPDACSNRYVNSVDTPRLCPCSVVHRAQYYNVDMYNT